MNTRVTATLLLAMTTTALGGCGGDSKTGRPASQPSSQATATEGEAPSRACSLLTAEQVTGVLPGHDGGSDKDTTEASLLEDVEMEHCQYLAADSENLGFLDVLIYTATSDAGVGSLPSHLRRCTDNECRTLDFGSPGFVVVWSDSPHVVVNADRQILDVALTSEGASAKSDALVELARSAAAKLGP